MLSTLPHFPPDHGPSEPCILLLKAFGELMPQAAVPTTAQGRMCAASGRASDSDEAWEEWLAKHPLPGMDRRAIVADPQRVEQVSDRIPHSGSQEALRKLERRFRSTQTLQTMSHAMAAGYDLSWDAALPGWRGELSPGSPTLPLMQWCSGPN